MSGGNFWQGAATGFIVSALNHAAHDGDGKKPKKDKNKERYVSNKKSITPKQFRDIYSGMTEGEIMIGESSFLGYKYPNDMSNPDTRFVMLENGKEVDMIHFMVVGRAGHTLGLANELQQTFRLKNSGFNPQDLYSNQLGVKFFSIYRRQISQNPAQISNYIHQYLTNPNVLYPPAFQPQFPTGPKYQYL